MLDEKAVSKAQQQAAGIALAAKRGKIHPSKLQGASQEMYNSMEDSDLNDFASTDTRRLPDRKEQKLREYIRKYIQEIVSGVDEPYKKQSIDEAGKIATLQLSKNDIQELLQIIYDLQAHLQDYDDSRYAETSKDCDKWEQILTNLGRKRQ